MYARINCRVKKEGGDKMTKGIIPFSCIDDVEELITLFQATGYLVTVVESKKYIRVERIDSNG